MRDDLTTTTADGSFDGGDSVDAVVVVGVDDDVDGDGEESAEAPTIPFAAATADAAVVLL
jgi:hypothetical protein